jgi:hypothetical protein
MIIIPKYRMISTNHIVRIRFLLVNDNIEIGFFNIMTTII